MSSNTWSVRLARAFALIRGMMLILFSVVLIAAPEKALPGSSAEPARSLGLIFASRTILLGVVIVALVLKRKRQGLAWVLFADAALQVFDTGMALAMSKGAMAVLPIALGAIDAWAGRVLLRAVEESVRSTPPTA